MYKESNEINKLQTFSGFAFYGCSQVLVNNALQNTGGKLTKTLPAKQPKFWEICFEQKYGFLWI